MAFRVIRDKRENLDRLKRQLAAIEKPRNVVIGVVAGKTEDSVIKYATINEFGANIKPRSFQVTTYKTLKKKATTVKAFDKYGNKRSIYKNKGRFVKADKANFAETHNVSHNGYKIPSRPFLRSYYDGNLEKIAKFTERQVAEVIMRNGDWSTALTRVGLYVQNGVRSHIRNSKAWAVPNAPATVRAKGSDKPLVDSSQLLNHGIQFELRYKS